MHIQTNSIILNLVAYVLRLEVPKEGPVIDFLTYIFGSLKTFPHRLPGLC